MGTLLSFSGNCCPGKGEGGRGARKAGTGNGTGNRQLVEFLTRLRAVNFQSVQTKYQRQARSKPSRLFLFAPTLQRMLSWCVFVCVRELCVLSFVDDGFDIVQGCSYY